MRRRPCSAWPAGRGQTIVGKIIGSLRGGHYVAVSDPRYVTGRFNSHLVSPLVLHADDGFWAGDQAAECKIKDLVTGDFHFVELKGKQPIKIWELTVLALSIRCNGAELPEIRQNSRRSGIPLRQRLELKNRF